MAIVVVATCSRLVGSECWQASALPARHSDRALDRALAVDGGCVGRICSCGPSSSPRNALFPTHRRLVAAGGALAVDGAGACRSYSCGSSSPLSTALCSRLVGGDCWRRQPAARCVMRIDSLCCEPRSRCRWRWRLKRLLVRLFVVAGVCFVFSTRRRRLLAMPARRWIRDEAQQLVVAGGSLAVDGAGVCRSYSCGSSSSAVLCTRLVAAIAGIARLPLVA